MNLTTRIERLYRYPVKLRDLLRDDNEEYPRESNSEDQEKGQRKWRDERKSLDSLEQSRQETLEKHLEGQNTLAQDNQLHRLNALRQLNLSCDEQMQYSKGKRSLLPLSKQLQERDAIQTSKNKPSSTGDTLDFVI
jgi:hypothetical protein